MSRARSHVRVCLLAGGMLLAQGGCDSIFGIDDPVVVSGDDASADASTDQPADGPVGAEGGSSSGASSSSGAGSDASSSSGSSSGAGSGSSSGPDGGCAPTNGCYVVPAGWTLVALRGDRNASCPAGMTQADVEENPSVPASACPCSCSVTTAPTCPRGVIQVSFDTGGALTCSMPGVPPSMNDNGTCSTSGFYSGGPSSYSQLDTEYTPPAATGGVCTSGGSPQVQNATATAERSCQPQTPPCTGNECTPSFPSPLQVCIAHSGVQTCPAGAFSQQHEVGTGVTFSCGTGCTCNTTASCTGTVELFTDNLCAQNQLSLVADGTCHGPATAAAQMYSSWKYAPNAPSNVACTAAGASSPQNVGLSNAQTLCCAP